MRLTFTLLSLLGFFFSQGQTSGIKGQLQDQENNPVGYANVALYSSKDSSLVKVETSDDSGVFQMRTLNAGNYFLKASFVGVGEIEKNNLELTEGQILDLGVLQFGNNSVELGEVTVTAQRAMVEVKPDRTVFNVQGTINSTGSDAIELLRKAPGVTVDNNDNINVLGRSGVLLYVDGKRLPLTGDNLSNFLKNLPAEQIDRMDIITNPGAKYEAEGNAGIIDIRLKRDKNHGTNGTVNGTFSHGELPQMNTGISLNHRNKKMNIFGNIGYGDYERFNLMNFLGLQNGLILDEVNRINNFSTSFNYRVGADFFIGKNQTIGLLIGGTNSDNRTEIDDRIAISNQSTSTQIDSFLVAFTNSNNDLIQNTFNVNYRFSKGDKSLNIDLDYGNYNSEIDRRLTNNYYKSKAQDILLTQVINDFDTPSDIDIYTAKLDYEDKLAGGSFGIGAKYSRVVSDNTFLFFDVEGGTAIQNNRRSNIFDYDENVAAAYTSYSRSINQKWSFSAGLRAEYTDILGDLTTFDPSLQEPPVDTSYLTLFPSAGITWQVAPMHSLALNYGRRINRPDYNVLNPFNNQLSELSFEKGNPFLFPEIVNNIELGYTLKYRYNFKIAYSKTTDQITRLIAPDDIDERASFITWANLATQEIWSANASLPMQIGKKWNAFFNVSAAYLDNQADYGENGVVDVQKFTYNIFQQHTFDLPWKLKGEISGWYAGPGVWGGVFEYDPSWSLNLGLQRKFFQNKLNVRISANDIFYETGWSGISVFNGLESTGNGNWDSRRVGISLNYSFGNQNVKSRKRKTGLEEEASRVGSGG